ncbi:MAG: hypothetical protein LCH54_17990, partial [Bacteroidetes bacterium]|nr:hypothetical protein [Bacteroidota bacterium]
SEPGELIRLRLTQTRRLLTDIALVIGADGKNGGKMLNDFFYHHLSPLGGLTNCISARIRDVCIRKLSGKCGGRIRAPSKTESKLNKCSDEKIHPIPFLRDQRRVTDPAF